MLVHLHSRSCYSLLNSTMNIETLVNKSKNLGYTQVALCDKNVLHGAMEFFYCCKRNGIKAIFGLEVDCIIDEKPYPFILIAKNDLGYKNLIKLSSKVCGEVNYCSIEDINEYSENCFLIVYGEGGYLESDLINEKSDDIYEKVAYLKSILPSFDVALSCNEISFWKSRNNLLKNICNKLNVKTVALNKIYYANENDDFAYKILRGISLQKTIHDKTLETSKGRYIRSREDMYSIYDKDDLKRSYEIANKCNVEFNMEKTSLPKFNVLNSKEYLINLCKKGLAKRLNNKVSKVYYDRLMYELDIITKMNFEDYFLIVWDFILFSRKNNIYVGPGRGSAAGSLVSYCLGITHIDPIKYNLLFERFLNPERISMPDIDIDFPDNRRSEVINYVHKTYGDNHIAHIITFNTLKTKQVLRDVGRVLNIPINEVDIICKSVPRILNISLKESYNQSERFKQLINSSEKYKELFKYSLMLENLPRHTSTHAAGIVMSRLKLDEVIPTIKIEDDMISTQYTMEYLEDLGLIKMDFLGLRNLTIIDEISMSIKNKNPNFDIMKIPLNDLKTFTILKNVDTVGIFQLESEGMKNLLRKMKVNRFEDIVAAIALFRPGPMENIPLYLDRRFNPSKIEYPHEDLIPILKETYGIMIYQEQIMQIVQLMANFTLGKSDVLRKAISKKNENELKTLESDFIKGCINNGYDKNLAINIYQLILKFAGYGFNKAHSVAYSLLAYQLAYLKANYTVEFYCSLLNSVIGDDTKTSFYVDQCKNHNIPILSPNINLSEYKYYIENNSLRFPLSCIKNVGNVSITSILNIRKKGEFKDYFDFVARVIGQKVNKKVIESLIDAGALDCFNISRKSMLLSLNDAINYGELVQVKLNDEITLNLDIVSKPILYSGKDNIMEKSEREKEVIGFYLSEHPIINIKKNMNLNLNSLIHYKDKTGYIECLVLIRKVRQYRTRKGDLMAFVNVSDESSDLDLIVMPSNYQKYNNILVKDNFIIFNGRIDKENSCIVKSIERINNGKVTNS